MRKRLLFLTHESENDNLVQTQLFPFANNVPEKSHLVYVLTFGNKSTFVKKVKNNVILISSSISWKNYRSYLLIFKLVIRLRIDVLHLRGINLFPIIYLVKKFRSFKIILDPRGAYPEEILMRFNSSILFFLVNWLERLYYITGDLVIFVSCNFKKHIYTKYPKFSKPSVVIPTFYVENLLTVSTNDSLNECSHNECLQLVYVGSMDVWQRFDHVIDYCNRLSDMSIQFHLFIITKNKHQVSKYITEANFSCYTVKSLQPFEIPNFLLKMDVAFIFRDLSVVNRVSSPVKIQEYLYSGLFVILSNDIGDLSEFIMMNNLGYIYNFKGESEVVASIRSYFQIRKQRSRTDSISIFLSKYNNSVKIENYLFHLESI